MPEAQMRADRASRYRQIRLIIQVPPRADGAAHVALFFQAVRGGVPEAQLQLSDWFPMFPANPTVEDALELIDAFVRRHML